MIVIGIIAASMTAALTVLVTVAPIPIADSNMRGLKSPLLLALHESAKFDLEGLGVICRGA